MLWFMLLLKKINRQWLFSTASKDPNTRHGLLRCTVSSSLELIDIRVMKKFACRIEIFNKYFVIHTVTPSFQDWWDVFFVELFWLHFILSWSRKILGIHRILMCSNCHKEKKKLIKQIFIFWFSLLRAEKEQIFFPADGSNWGWREIILVGLSDNIVKPISNTSTHPFSGSVQQSTSWEAILY